MPIRIIIADDHEIFRDGFSMILKNQTEVEIVGAAENGNELIDLAEKLHPDVVLTDIKMPVMDGIEATKVMKKKYPSIGIIAISMFNETHFIVDMLEAGASGYLLKNARREEILMAVKTVYSQGNYYDASTSVKLAKLIARSGLNSKQQTSLSLFSKREIEIIHLICRQFSNREMALELDLSTRTIEGHRERIQEKMQVKNVVGIVIYAIKNGIFDPDKL